MGNGNGKPQEGQKSLDKMSKEEIKEFQNIIDSEITRPLKKQQDQASFFLARMKGGANFSVPGAGKTEIHATQELNASVSGVGSIVYEGDPKVKKSVSGIGSISKK